MQPVLSGVGGDLFAIVWDPKTRQVYGYNGSGRSAKGRDLAKLTAEVEAAWKKAGKPYQAHIPHFGSLSITVPGTVDAWFALHERFGKLGQPSRRLFESPLQQARSNQRVQRRRFASLMDHVDRGTAWP